MHSLYRGNYHFTTYLATAKALQALGACGEVPEMPPMAAVPSKPPEALK
jgi:hypothetical protein